MITTNHEFWPVPIESTDTKGAAHVILVDPCPICGVDVEAIATSWEEGGWMDG